MARRLSCGILVVASEGELLLGHASGTPRWDVFKGLAEPGETPRATAVREAAEEAGLLFEPDDLADLGRHAYLPAKDLHLHAALVERFEPSRCRCSTHYRD